VTDRYSACDDEYTYPGTGVLRNKADLRDATELERFERTHAAIRALEPGPPRSFDYAHLLAIHRQLFQDVYEWAGQERTVLISKENTPFCNPLFMRGHADKLFAGLLRERLLRGLGPEDFAARAAYYMNELNMLHPFREGNGRVVREFLRQLAENAGYGLDPSRFTREAWLEVCRQGAREDEKPMAALIASALAPPSPVATRKNGGRRREGFAPARRASKGD
jgi:cell filamentation protein